MEIARIVPMSSIYLTEADAGAAESQAENEIHLIVDDEGCTARMIINQLPGWVGLVLS